MEHKHSVNELEIMLHLAKKARPPRKLTWSNLAPCLVTSLGAFLASAGLLMWPSPAAGVFLALSLCCDCLDGKMARAFNAESDFGREFDWATDVLVFAGMTWRCSELAPFILPFMAAFHALMRNDRVSGRSLATLAVLLILVFGNPK